MKIKIKNIFLALTVLLLVRCANVVTPTGGPKDVTPPKVEKAIPENRSVGFDGHKIEITFDEYITLDNAQQNILFSPPLKTKLDIKLSNKTVVIKFKESLLQNTTYTLHFGSAIKDLHEGNIFNDYTYSFSTGDYLDTLQIKGKVLDAESKKPVQDLQVGVYSCEHDSLFDRPMIAAPDYLAMTDKEGNFTIFGLPDKRYLVFALKDMNSNRFYDMPNEMVAFLDTLVPANQEDLVLYAFTEKDTTQMLLEKKLVDEGLLRFVFRQPADSVIFETPEMLPDTFQIVKIWSENHDTLWWHFTPDVLDSLQVYIRYDTIINDSTNYSLRYRETKQQTNKASKALKITNNLKNNLLMPDEDFVLKFTEPVTRLQWHDTSLIKAGDSIIYDLAFEKADEYGMEYCLSMEIVDTLKYSVNLTDSVFFSLRGRTNDSLSIQFNRAQEKDLGNLFITVVPPEDTQIIVQLLNSRDKVVATALLAEERRVEFRQLLPEKYKLKAIFDTNRDGRWSTGNFHQFFLPETVIDYKDELDLKAGWDIDLEEKWILF